MRINRKKQLGKHAVISGIRMPQLRCTRVSESDILRRASLALCACLLFTAVFVGCGTEASDEPVDPNRLQVMASFYTMYDFAQKIGGEHVQVTCMVPSGTEPHDWEPSTKDITRMEQADVFIYNGAGMEHWVSDVLAGLSNKKLTLKAKESFRTPELALTYSKDGLSGSSRNFHAWARKHKIANGATARKILLNSWEGVYFDINQEGMDQMMSDIQSMGGELFVMDDGWFGDKYPRNKDNSSLGDWMVDARKLRGIEGLIADANKHGIKFGIWIEPEMANTTSELYEKHPEWVLKAPNREIVLGRGGTQVVLDLSNPEVQDFIFGIVDNLMTTYPEIDYIKWDANMSILNHGSQYLPSDQQSHMYIEYHEGFKKVCERIRAKYPDLTLQACASGGGRANYGVMPYFDEFWVSDNTDALQRIYMQWGTSYFFPAIAMASLRN